MPTKEEQKNKYRTSGEVTYTPPVLKKKKPASKMRSYKVKRNSVTVIKEGKQTEILFLQSILKTRRYNGRKVEDILRFKNGRKYLMALYHINKYAFDLALLEKLK